jgi:hypothetical protein
MAFAGLYQLTHEMIKQVVLDKLRDFYCLGAIGPGDVMSDEELKQYDRDVLATGAEERVSGAAAVADPDGCDHECAG